MVEPDLVGGVQPRLEVVELVEHGVEVQALLLEQRPRGWIVLGLEAGEEQVEDRTRVMVRADGLAWTLPRPSVEPLLGNAELSAGPLVAVDRERRCSGALVSWVGGEALVERHALVADALMHLAREESVKTAAVRRAHAGVDLPVLDRGVVEVLDDRVPALHGGEAFSKPWRHLGLSCRLRGAVGVSDDDEALCAVRVCTGLGVAPGQALEDGEGQADARTLEETTTLKRVDHCWPPFTKM